MLVGASFVNCKLIAISEPAWYNIVSQRKATTNYHQERRYELCCMQSVLLPMNVKLCTFMSTAILSAFKRRATKRDMQSIQGVSILYNLLCI